MLVACPDCRESVSDQAAACPRCGHPISSWGHGVKQWIVRTYFGDRIEGVVFLMALFYVLSVISVPIPWPWVWGVVWMPIWALNGQPVIWPVVVIEWVVIGGVGGAWIGWLRSRAAGSGSQP